MSHTAYSQHYYNCEAEGIEVYFEYNNSVVFDTGKKTINSGGMHSQGNEFAGGRNGQGPKCADRWA